MGEGLLELAKRCELREVEKYKTMFLELSSLETLLNDVYETHRPSSQEFVNRRNLIQTFNEIAREIYGNNDKCPVVKEFGSFLMELFDATSDLDLSINFRDTEEKPDRRIQVKTLRKFANKLQSLQKNQIVSDIQLILSARVPVLKVTHRSTRVECGLSVGNLDGIEKSQIVLMISTIDERFQKLCVLMKVWAKANNINSAKDGTINSLSIILLVAFHLQTRDIPILPPFSAILKDGLDPVAVHKNIQHVLHYGERNKESLAELFVSMLIKLESIDGLWSNGLCASTYEGSWIFKSLGCVSIEDFADRSQNTSRALKVKNKEEVYKSISGSIKQIHLFHQQKIDATELKNILFKPKPKSEVSANTNNKKTTGKRKRKQQAQKGPAQSKNTSGNPKKRCTSKSKASGSSKSGWVGTSNVTSTSYGGADMSQAILVGVCQQLLLAANTFQGYGGVRPVGNPLLNASLHSRTGQQMSMSNPPIQSYRGNRSDNSQVWPSHAAPNFMPAHPLSVSNLPFQGSTGFRLERTHVGPPHSFHGRPPHASTGFRPTHTEDLDHVAPRFPRGQRFDGYRPERIHVEHFRHPPDSFMPPRLSHHHSAHVTDPRWPERSYDPRVYPPVPSQFTQSSHAPDYRESSGRRSYQPHGNRPPPPSPLPRY